MLCYKSVFHYLTTSNETTCFRFRFVSYTYLDFSTDPLSTHIQLASFSRHFPTWLLLIIFFTLYLSPLRFFLFIPRPPPPRPYLESAFFYTTVDFFFFLVFSSDTFVLAFWNDWWEFSQICFFCWTLGGICIGHVHICQGIGTGLDWGWFWRGKTPKASLDNG
jgi:hypothetical protein